MPLSKLEYLTISLSSIGFLYFLTKKFNLKQDVNNLLLNTILTGTLTFIGKHVIQTSFQKIKEKIHHKRSMYIYIEDLELVSLISERIKSKAKVQDYTLLNTKGDLVEHSGIPNEARRDYKMKYLVKSFPMNISINFENMNIMLNHDDDFFLEIKRSEFNEQKFRKFISSCSNNKSLKKLRVYEWSTYKSAYIGQFYQRKEKVNYINFRLDELLIDLKKFFSLKQQYLDNGIPFKKGYLFYGPPGTGKTTLIIMAANQLNLPIYKIHLGDIKLNSQQIADAYASIIAPCLVIIEDLDCANDLIIHTLLDILDGAGSEEGVLFFFTTNFYQNILDKMNPALLRPGRIDIIQEISYLNILEINSYIQKFYKNTNLKIEQNSKKLTFAALQQLCLKYHDNSSELITFLA